jgi:hypothetical protein
MMMTTTRPVQYPYRLEDSGNGEGGGDGDDVVVVVGE